MWWLCPRLLAVWVAVRSPPGGEPAVKAVFRPDRVRGHRAEAAVIRFTVTKP